MIFTAYVDESGTHAGAELTGMAGFLGDRRQWQKFEKRNMFRIMLTRDKLHDLREQAMQSAADFTSRGSALSAGL
jgi:hypothetical protein